MVGYLYVPLNALAYIPAPKYYYAPWLSQPMHKGGVSRKSHKIFTFKMGIWFHYAG